MTDTALAMSFRADLRACTACELRDHCKEPVPWYGNFSPKYAVIGEAPGRSEDAAGIPFIGPAGIRLKYLLKKGGIDPEKEVTYLNACNCFPGDTIRNPQPKHIAACRKWMRGQIAFIQPEYVITVGTVAFASVRDIETWPKLASLHGKPLKWDGAPIPASPKCLWPVYHPSSALRSGKYQKLIEGAMVDFKTWRGTGEIWPDICYVCKPEDAVPVYRYDGWGIGYCERHAQRQGMLWPEDQLTQ